MKKIENRSSFKSENGKIEYLKTYNKTLSIWPVPYQEIDVKTSFGFTHIIVSGPENAEPLVLLHGSLASSTMWFPNIKELSVKYRTFAVDIILEPGKSALEKQMKDNQETADWLIEVFDSLNLRKPSIIGLSRGGWLAVNLALHSKNRINKIVLLSPAQTFISVNLRFILETIIMLMFPSDTRIRRFENKIVLKPESLNELFSAQYHTALKNLNIKNAVGVPAQLFSDEELKALDIPVLLLIGDHDIVNNSESMKRAGQLIPDFEGDIIKEAGHSLTLDQPQIVNKKILEFLSG